MTARLRKPVMGSVFGSQQHAVVGTVFSGKPALLPDTDVFDRIEVRLDRQLSKLRAELSELAPDVAQSVRSHRPQTAPARAVRSPERQTVTSPQRMRQPPSNDVLLLYMARFETRQTRAAGGAAPRAPGCTTASPGRRPLGYRIKSKNESSPAYTFRPKILLSRDVDPYAADDTPGPGACMRPRNSRTRHDGQLAPILSTGLAVVHFVACADNLLKY